MEETNQGMVVESKNPKRERGENGNGLDSISASKRIMVDPVADADADEGEKTCVYFRVQRILGVPDAEAVDTDWYCINLKPNDGDGVLTARKMNVRPPTPAYSSTCVAVGSVIYVLGGIRYLIGATVDDLELRLLSDVFCYDTNNPDKGWFQGPPMSVPRCVTHYAVIDRKIYIIGGVGEFNNRTIYWGEFLDTACEGSTWQPLPLPGERQRMNPSELPKIEYFDPCRQILARLPGSCTILVCYDVIDQSWRQIDDCFWFDKPLLVDDEFIIYATRMKVWTLGTDGGGGGGGKLWFGDRIHTSGRGLDSVLPQSEDGLERVSVVRLGPNKFALLWCTLKVKETSKKLGRVNFAVFTLATTPDDWVDDPCVRASVKLQQYLPIDPDYYELDACIAL